MTRHTNTWERLWEQLNESTEGPTVHLELPRADADRLLNMLASSLEIDGDIGGSDHEEPDADDFGGPPDGDEDDMGLPMGPDQDDDGFADFAAGDDDEDDSESDDDDSDDDEEEEEDDEDDDDEETDEAVDYRSSGGNPSGLRTQTALGESRRRNLSEAYSWRTPSRRQARRK